MRSVVSVRPSIRHLFPLYLVNQLTFDLDYLPAKCTSSKIIVLERVLKRPVNVLMFVLTDLGMPLNMTASSVLFFRYSTHLRFPFTHCFLPILYLYTPCTRSRVVKNAICSPLGADSFKGFVKTAKKSDF